MQTNDTLAHIDMETVEDHVLAALAEPEAKEKAPPAHVTSFYERMGNLMSAQGIEGKSMPDLAMRALAIKSAGDPMPRKFGRLDRKRAINKGIQDGTLVKAKPLNLRNVSPTCKVSAVETFMDKLPDDAKPDTPEALAVMIGRQFGYGTADAMMQASMRANRFISGKKNRRIPAHIRLASVMSSAIMVAICRLFPDQASQEMHAQVTAMRGSELTA